MGRAAHTFQFSAGQIREAAAREAQYHEDRAKHWADRRDQALEVVRGTIGAKIAERPVTGGYEIDVVVDYGDPEAWAEFRLAWSKERHHREDAEKLRSDERLYATQGDRSYELGVDDVYHYRLADAGEREE